MPEKKKAITIKELGEFGFIQSITPGALFSSQKLIKGIGDDCAVIGPYEDKLFLLTCDILTEGVHFILEKTTPEFLGEKAVAVNLSDISAMGGTPRHILISVAAPGDTPVDTLQRLYKGIYDMCKQYRVNVLGGDTSGNRAGLVINITVIGEAPEGEVLYRSGARPGDSLFVTGNLGDSRAGLKLITGEIHATGSEAEALKAAHLRPRPLVEAGRLIARSGLASSMIDLSDGLLSDLGHICEASRVGARLFMSALPISPELMSVARTAGVDHHEMALSGGEDYELLITVPGKNTSAFQDMFEKEGHSKVYIIGEVVAGEGITIVREDGGEEKAEPGGFKHFMST